MGLEWLKEIELMAEMGEVVNLKRYGVVVSYCLQKMKKNEKRTETESVYLLYIIGKASTRAPLTNRRETHHNSLRDSCKQSYQRTGVCITAESRHHVDGPVGFVVIARQPHVKISRRSLQRMLDLDLLR